MAVDAPNTPTQLPAAAAPTGPVDDSLPAVVGGSVAGGSSSPAVPTMAELLQFLAKQGERTNAIIEMMALDKKSNAHYTANTRLDEKYFRSIDKFNHTKSGRKEWRRHFLNAVRDCDDTFADLIEGYEKSETPLDHLLAYNPTQGQQSTNLYNRLIGHTTGTAFQTVESVPDHDGARHGVC